MGFECHHAHCRDLVARLATYEPAINWFVHMSARFQPPKDGENGQDGEQGPQVSFLMFDVAHQAFAIGKRWTTWS